VSPSHGLLVYSPMLAFAVAGILGKIRGRTFDRLDATLLTCVVVHWIATAWVNPIWWGGDSYGPRLLADLLPFFFYWLVPAVRSLSELGGVRRTLASAAVVAAAMMSVAAHAQGALNPKAMAWNYDPSPPDQDPEKLWDWRHAPFLAGVVAPRGAAPCTSAAPPPPRDLHVVSNGNRDVTVSWSAPAAAVGLYTVESGKSPGASDQPLRDTTGTTLTVRRIPPGTYYARVRARNACGLGEPSNELTITVR
jgi:fibronectin type III domain protein